MKFRLIRIMNLPYSLFNKEKKFIGKWVDCNKITIKEMKEIEKGNNQSLQRGIIKDWWLEYKR